MRSKILFSIISVILFVGVLFLSACKPENNCIAGSNGNYTVVAYLKNQDRKIVNHEWHPDTVWVKYNALQAPDKNTTGYDTIIVGEEGEDHVHIKNLKCGDYFFYAAGLDTILDTTIYPHVTGGYAFSIPADKSAGETEIMIPVSQ